MRKRTLSNPKAQQLVEARAREMRFAPTASEAKLWRFLKGEQLGVRVVRQVVIAGYIVDFLAPREKVVIEVDGGCHAVRTSADTRRDRVLERLGYRVLRIEARSVYEELEVVLARVTEELGR